MIEGNTTRSFLLQRRYRVDNDFVALIECFCSLNQGSDRDDDDHGSIVYRLPQMILSSSTLFIICNRFIG
jgi:hypothetical protein